MRISDWSSDVCSSDLTLDGLGTLASAARARSHARVAAVTGSVGKTGVKEALLLVLAQQAQAHASAGNLNNHRGVPLSLARLPSSASSGIFSLGINHPGDIAPHSRMVRPHAAVLNTVTHDHAHHSASLEPHHAPHDTHY